MTTTTLSLSQTLVQGFIEAWANNAIQGQKHLRVGQAFHQHFSLEKITNTDTKVFCDRLYEADGDKAWKMIESITDYAQ